MKIQTTSILAALAGLSFAAGSANAVTIINGDFSSTTRTNTNGGPTSIGGYTGNGWYFNDQGSRTNWIISSGRAVYSGPTTGEPRTRVMTQVFNDNKATTGINNLNFDIQLTNLKVDANSDFGVYVYGWNDGDIAPIVDHSAAIGLALSTTTVVTNQNDAVRLTADFSVFENGNTFAPGVDLVAGYDPVSVSTDFGGAGYDNIAVLLAVSLNSTDTQSIVEIDNVSFDTVPEPSSFALLGLGGLTLIFRRRK